MRFILTALRSTTYSLFLLFIILTSLVLFLLTTTPGLYLCLKLASFASPGQLTVKHLQGRLIDNFSFEQLIYQDKQTRLELDHFALQWKIKALFDRHIAIKQLQINTLDLAINSVETVKETTEHSFSLPKLPLAISIKNAEIKQLKLRQDTVLHQIEALQLEAQLNNEEWLLEKLNLIFEEQPVSLTGKLQTVLPYALQARLALKPADKKTQTLDGFLDLGGDSNLYHWHGEFKKPGKLVLNGTLTKLSEFHTTSHWQEIKWPLDKKNILHISKGKLTVAGKFPELSIDLETSSTSPVQAEWQLHADTVNQGVKADGKIKLSETEIGFNLAYQSDSKPKVQGTIQAHTLDKPINLPIKQLRFNTQFSANSLDDLLLNTELNALYFDTPLYGTLSHQQQAFQGVFHLGSNQLTFKGSLPYQWQADIKIPAPQLLHPELKGLATTITATANLKTATEGDLLLTITPGHYQLAEEELVKNLAFAGGQFRGILSPQGLRANGKLTIDPSKSLILAMELPKFQLEKGITETQPVQGKLSLKVNSLAFLENLSNEITQVQGKLEAVLQAQGTAGHPIITGNIQLSKAKASLPKLGVELNPVQLTLNSQEKAWQAQGSLSSNGRPLIIQGKGEFSPELRGSINLTSDDFPLINTAEYKVLISPKLAVEFKQGNVDLKGSILIPKAQLKPQTFSDSVSLSDDAVFVGNKPASNSLPINTDLQLEMGNEVAIDVKGLHGFLTGAINLRQLPKGPLNASGELSIRDGKYQAYGQDLTIEQGQLLFTGGLIENPGLRIRAIREFKNTTNSFAGSNQLFDFDPANMQTLDFGDKTKVGIEVTGRIRSHKIQLFSVPAGLSQADILSMLLLGRPASQANEAGGQLLLAAISSMNLGSGSGGLQLLEQLKQKLGFDFNFQSNSKYNQQTNQISGNNSLVVGKSLSKRLYASYNVGLAHNDSNVFTLNYLLNKFFSIQVNASTTASGIDLLYTHKKD